MAPQLPVQEHHESAAVTSAQQWKTDILARKTRGLHLVTQALDKTPAHDLNVPSVHLAVTASTGSGSDLPHNARIDALNVGGDLLAMMAIVNKAKPALPPLEVATVASHAAPTHGATPQSQDELARA